MSSNGSTESSRESASAPVEAISSAMGIAAPQMCSTDFTLPVRRQELLLPASAMY